MVAPVKDCMRYYDYWTKALNHIKNVLNNTENLYEMESDLMKIVECLDLDYCKGYATDGVHRTWVYWWKSEVFDMLTHLMHLQKTMHHKSYDHDEIMESWKRALSEINENIDINLLILNGEIKGCERR